MESSGPARITVVSRAGRKFPCVRLGWTLCALVVIVAFACAASLWQSGAHKTPRTIEFWLDEPITSLHGIKLFKMPPSGPWVGEVDEWHNVRIHLPDHRVFLSGSTATSVDANKSHLTGVSICPLRAATSWKKADEAVSSILAALGPSLLDPELVAKQFAEWRTEVPDPAWFKRTHYLRANLRGEAMVEFAMLSYTNSPGDTWFVSAEFYTPAFQAELRALEEHDKQHGSWPGRDVDLVERDAIEKSSHK